jgi:hypothetical protein
MFELCSRAASIDDRLLTVAIRQRFIGTGIDQENLESIGCDFVAIFSHHILLGLRIERPIEVNGGFFGTDLRIVNFCFEMMQLVALREAIADRVNQRDHTKD